MPTYLQQHAFLRALETWMTLRMDCNKAVSFDQAIGERRAFELHAAFEEFMGASKAIARLNGN